MEPVDVDLGGKRAAVALARGEVLVLGPLVVGEGLQVLGEDEVGRELLGAPAREAVVVGAVLAPERQQLIAPVIGEDVVPDDGVVHLLDREAGFLVVEDRIVDGQGRHRLAAPADALDVLVCDVADRHPAG